MRVLITGSTGLLGKALFETKPIHYFAIGIHLRKLQNISNNAENFQLDIRDKINVEHFFQKYKIDAVIHTAGIANVDYVKNNYAESFESNIVGTFNIASACKKNGVNLFYISSNAIFDGNTPPYNENSEPNPINQYGKMKLECENIVEKIISNSSIIRPVLMYGWNYPRNRQNLVTWVLEKIIKNEKIKLVNDVSENPIYNLDCARAIWQIIGLKLKGKIHLAGPEATNRYQFGIQIANIFGLNENLISPVNSDYFFELDARPKNTFFSTNKMLENLKIFPLSIQDGLLDMKKELLENIKNSKYLDEIPPYIIQYFKENNL